MKYVPTQDEATDIEHRFTYHVTSYDQADRCVQLRAKAKELAELMLLSCPPSRERSLAFGKIEEAVMWGNASIARNEKEQG